MRLGVTLRVTLAAAVMAAVFSLSAAAPAAAQDARRGAALAEERSCAACHGLGGLSAVPLMPSLAGQQPHFLTLQLILFRESLRTVPAMAEAVRGLTDEQIEDLSAYFAANPSAPNPDRGPRDAGLAARGAELSVQRNCNVCHLPSYAGRAQVPRINHQREDFLLHTLVEYRDNQRVGTDTQMNAVMFGMSDDDIRAIAHYLAHR